MSSCWNRVARWFAGAGHVIGRARVPRLAVAILFVVTALAQGSPRGGAAESYDFPFVDPFAATVVGTPAIYRAELPPVDLQERPLQVLPEREVPSVFWYTDRLRYGFLAQQGAAPLAFVIAGTGAGHDAQKVRILVSVFHQIGFHVITLPSTTHQNFIVNASTTSMPGRITEDAADLYRAMQKIYDRVKDEIEVTSFHLTGYSLGAAQSAFVAKLDEEVGHFDFERVLMINPPLSLYQSALIIDQMLEDNAPDGISGVFRDTMAGFAQVYDRTDRLDFDDDFFYRVYQVNEPSGEQLAAVIGWAFRFSSASMTFTADVMTNAGYIAAATPELRATDSLTTYASVAMRTSFSDYVDDLFLPHFQATDPSLTLERLEYETNLRSIENYLRSSTKIGLMHNEDDIIMEDGDIDYLRDVFGDRAQIYIKGGHCGNMDYPDNVAHMIDFFTK